ncbi:MAG: hypothetical protein HY047_19830 [Acidobacteria bacterium]|nr:hypothetical protein [Acidobacteriota bacterium]
MNRRDFLLLRIEQRRRVAELSCERLYMRYMDSQLPVNQYEEPVAIEPAFGEPAPVFDQRSIRQVFDDLDHELRLVDVLHVFETRWLTGGELRAEFDRFVTSFRAHGGRIEFRDA